MVIGSYLELQLADLEKNAELESNLRLRLALPIETDVVDYQCRDSEEQKSVEQHSEKQYSVEQNSEEQQSEEQHSPLDLKISKSHNELKPGGKCSDLCQMLPVDAIIEVINEEEENLPALMDDDFLLYPGTILRL